MPGNLNQIVEGDFACSFHDGEVSAQSLTNFANFEQETNPSLHLLVRGQALPKGEMDRSADCSVGPEAGRDCPLNVDILVSIS